MVADSIFRVIGEIGMSRPVGILDRVVVFSALIGVLDQQRDRRSRRHLTFGVFVVKNAGQDFDLIGLLPLCGKATLAGTALIEEELDVTFFERDQGRAAIDHASDRNPMAFTKSRDPEEMAEGVVRHGRLTLSPSEAAPFRGSSRAPFPSRACRAIVFRGLARSRSSPCPLR